MAEVSRVRMLHCRSSDVDLTADTDSDQVPSDGYNDGRAHITVVAFLHKRVFRPKTLEIIIDLLFGFFPINMIISLTGCELA